MEKQTIYDVIDSTVKELNANVLIGTIYGKGYKYADLYTSVNECNILVGKDTCPPIGAIYVKTVIINIPIK